MYCSAPYLNEFYKCISNCVKKITSNYEIIFVNDGSPDNSLELALNLFKKDKKIKIIDLSRNFGHHKAIMTGLSFAKGEYIFLIDNDLEEDPGLLKIFWQELNKHKDVDVIYGVRTNRGGDFIRKYLEKFYYKIFNFFSNIKIRENLTITRLMTKRYVKTLMQFKENDIVFAGVCALSGFNQKYITVNKRCKKSSTYTFYTKINMLIDTITSFSEKPLLYISYVGFSTFLISVYMILNQLYRKIILREVLIGWTSLIISIWFFGSLLLLSVGMVGIYLSKIFIETKKRPYTIVKHIYEYH